MSLWFRCAALTPLLAPVSVNAQDAEIPPYEERGAEHREDRPDEAATGKPIPSGDATPDRGAPPPGPDEAAIGKPIPSGDATPDRGAPPPQDAAKEEPPDTTFRVFWKEGLRLETADGVFEARIGGRTEVDFAWLSEDRRLNKALGDLEDGVELRRAQLYVSGLIDSWIEYEAAYDFSSGSAGVEAVYVGFTKLPYVGRIRIGHMDEPFGLELRTSDRFTTFMERGLTHALVPGKEMGVLAKNRALDGLIFWGAGVFRDTDAPGSGSGDAYSLTGRVSILPWYDAEGTRLLHLGVGGSHRTNDETVRFRSRPEAHLSSVHYVDTGDIHVDADARMGLELAWVHGPLSLQGEYMVARVDLAAESLVFMSARYAFLSWFLTGESRTYDLGSATFDRPRPFNNFRGPEGGWGAWEFAVRYSQIDLDDGVVRGGRQDDVTVGLNWYFNPNAKVALNYIHAFVDHDAYDGDVDILQMRVQVDF